MLVSVLWEISSAEPMSLLSPIWITRWQVERSRWRTPSFHEWWPFCLKSEHYYQLTDSCLPLSATMILSAYCTVLFKTLTTKYIHLSIYEFQKSYRPILLEWSIHLNYMLPLRRGILIKYSACIHNW